MTEESYLPGDEYFCASEWDMGDYVDLQCPNCGRHRVCLCDNGKHRCDKCNWIVEDSEYCIEPLDKF
jgi:ribosomal protein L37AE/L43A